jgi:hypothetical protein
MAFGAPSTNMNAVNAMSAFHIMREKNISIFVNASAKTVL